MVRQDIHLYSLKLSACQDCHPSTLAIPGRRLMSHYLMSFLERLHKMPVGESKIERKKKILQPRNKCPDTKGLLSLRNFNMQLQCFLITLITRLVRHRPNSLVLSFCCILSPTNRMGHRRLACYY